MARLQGGVPHRILLVHTHYRLAGGEDTVFEAERELLAAHGHQVTVYERTNAEADQSLLKKLLLPFTAVYSPKTVREVRALIRREHIELVHVHNTLLVTSPSVFYACFREKVPVVQTLHNFRLFCPNGVLLRGGTICEECTSHGLRCAVRHRCYRGSRAQSLVCAAVYGVHRLLGTYKRVELITPTEFDRQKLLEFNGRRPVFEPARLHVKPNPVRVEELPPVPVQNQILFAGRLEELKGIRTVMEAWKLLGEDAPLLLVAGDGPLAAWAKANAGPRVEFLGRVTPQELHRRMAQSRAVVAPSLCYESFALVPAEAHALGVPVLASDLGNVGASVTDGVDGLRFAPGDAAALAAAVRRLDEIQFDRAAIRDAARADCGAEENYRALLAVYAAAIGKEKP
ncbi:MAG: glycosyltransferase [Gemmiger sp.]